MVMSQAGAAQAADLGPLAWVLDETRRSIETASKKTLSFARDAKLMVEAGWRIDWVQPVGQFRWSTHVELAARLSRAT